MVVSRSDGFRYLMQVELEENPLFDVVQGKFTEKDALEAIEREKPEIALLIEPMYDPDSFAIMRKLKESGSTVKCALLVAVEDERLIKLAKDCGAYKTAIFPYGMRQFAKDIAKTEKSRITREKKKKLKAEQSLQN
jgi:DNA-binding NarL/FixJ family response regulator